VMVVGDAAGQSKPTTAGGIYSCGMGGVLAGRAVVEEAAAGSESAMPLLLTQYEKKWSSMFKSEFDKMLLARRFMERLDNKAIDDLVAAISPKTVEQASVYGDFDFHTSALAKMLASKAAARMAKALLNNEMRRFLESS